MLWWIWLIIGIFCVFIEVVTGTFFFLSLAIGFASAAIVSSLEGSLSWQLGIVSLVTVVSLFIFNRLGLLRFKGHNAHEDSLDIGQVVQVSQWAADGTTTVTYRGALWSARLQPEAAAQGAETPLPGLYEIVAVNGITLLLRPA